MRDEFGAIADIDEDIGELLEPSYYGVVLDGSVCKYRRWDACRRDGMDALKILVSQPGNSSRSARWRVGCLPVEVANLNAGFVTEEANIPLVANHVSAACWDFS